MIDTKILALYLPQYYDTNYNNDWWGNHYTEWVACKQAKPLYKNHYQPRLPLSGNFYDLSNVDEIKNQIKIAKEYGIDGFVIYQYFSVNNSEYGDKLGDNGSLLLNYPTELILLNKDCDIPFCLYWANHDWRKQWFGENPTLLWKQEYGNQDDWDNFFEYNLKFFKDDRYIKIDNKPVYFIFAEWHFKNIDDFIKRWNELAIKNGFNGIFFIKTDDSKSHKELGAFDASFRREPFYTFAKGFGKLGLMHRFVTTRSKKLMNVILNKFNFGIISYKCDYDKLWKKILKQRLESKIIPGCVAEWDNTARKGYNAQMLIGASPEKFGRYFSQLYTKCKKFNVPFLVINAWNEWAEGAYLEPDERYKYSYLEKIRIAKIME